MRMRAKRAYNLPQPVETCCYAAIDLAINCYRNYLGQLLAGNVQIGPLGWSVDPATRSSALPAGKATQQQSSCPK